MALYGESGLLFSLKADDKVSGVLEKINGQLRDHQGLLKGIGIAAVVGGTIAVLKQATSNAEEYTKSIGELVKVTGMAPEVLSKMAAATSAAGVEYNEYTATIKALTEAQDKLWGSGAGKVGVEQMLNYFKIDPEEFKRLKDFDEITKRMADRVEGMTPRQQVAFLETPAGAMLTSGMMEYLVGGRAGIARAEGEARAPTVTKEDLMNQKLYNIEQKKIGDTYLAMGNDIKNVFYPATVLLQDGSKKAAEMLGSLTGALTEMANASHKNIPVIGTYIRKIEERTEKELKEIEDREKIAKEKTEKAMAEARAMRGRDIFGETAALMFNLPELLAGTAPGHVKELAGMEVIVKNEINPDAFISAPPASTMGMGVR